MDPISHDREPEAPPKKIGEDFLADMAQLGLDELRQAVGPPELDFYGPNHTDHFARER